MARGQRERDEAAEGRADEQRLGAPIDRSNAAMSSA